MENMVNDVKMEKVKAKISFSLEGSLGRHRYLHFQEVRGYLSLDSQHECPKCQS